MDTYKNTLLDNPQAQNKDILQNTLIERADIEDKESRMQEAFGPKKVNYSEWFVNKMYEFLDFETDYVKQLRTLNRANNNMLWSIKWEKPPKERAEFIKSRAVDIGAKKLALAQEHYTRLIELMAENRVNGTDRKLFFEYPLVLTEPRHFFWYSRERTVLDEIGYSLYCFNQSNEVQKYYSDFEGYKSEEHIAQSYCAGELDFVIYDGQQMIDEKHRYGIQEQLYFADHLGSYWTNGHYIQKIYEDGKFVPLYCDYDFINEHITERYTLCTLWDYDCRSKCIVNGKKTVDECLNDYCNVAKDMTEVSCFIFEGGLCSDYREHVTQNKHKKSADAAKPKVSQTERYMKKALIVKYDKKIVAVFIPKKASDVLVIGSMTTEMQHLGQWQILKKVERVEVEQGVNWEGFAATTMHYVANYLAKDFSARFDVTEEKPEQISDNLWRFWIRERCVAESEMRQRK